MSLYEIVFSPTGDAAKVAGILSAGLGKDPVRIDVTEGAGSPSSLSDRRSMPLFPCSNNGTILGPFAYREGDAMDMDMDIEKLEWTRKPAECLVAPGRVEIMTEPHTDLWQRTYYHFRNDSAPVLQMTTAERFFSFVVRCDFSGSAHRFDQCGVALYLDSENWLKASVEYENEHFAHLGSVVTNHGYSDWATTEIPATVKSMWYRLSRREDDFRIECSEDGAVFRQMRICHMWDAQDEVRFGVYACSPEDSSFRAVFTDLALTECAWLAHDGQAPDENL